MITTHLKSITAIGVVFAISARGEVAHADDADYLKKQFAERVAFVNQTCGTSIAGTTSKPTQACDHLFSLVRMMCGSSKHPAVQKWFQANVKSLACSAGPNKISLQGGKLDVTVDDKGSEYFAMLDNAFSDSSAKHKEGKTLKAFASLHLAKRLHDVTQALVPIEKQLNEACGSKISIAPDLASWQAGGFLSGYFPDLDVPDVARQYAFKLSKMCEAGSKDLIARSLSRIVVRFVGREQNQTWEMKDKVELAVAGGVLTLTVVSSTPGPTMLHRIEADLPGMLTKAKPAPRRK